MVTSTGAPDLGNIVGDFFDPIKKAFSAFVKNGEKALQADASAALSEVSNALTNASTIVAAAQAKADTVVNGVVNTGLASFTTAVSAAYPPIAPLLSAADHEIETLADEGTDAILNQAISHLATFLSQAGKSTAAVKLSNLAGAQ